MDNISRVLFPVISRIQHDKVQIGKVIDRILYYQTLILAPHPHNHGTLHAKVSIYHTQIWQVDTRPSRYFIFSVSPPFFSSYSSPFMNLFNALGKVKISFILMFVWTVSTWILTPLFTIWFGYFGFPFVLLIIASSSLAVSFIAKRFISFHFF